MPYLFILFLLLTFKLGDQDFTISIDDSLQVEIKVKKDQKRLNKIFSRTSNKYGNKDDGHIEDFL